MWGNEDVDMDMYSFKDVKKEQQKKLDVGGMRTLTWICIVSKLWRKSSRRSWMWRNEDVDMDMYSFKDVEKEQEKKLDVRE